MQEEGESERKIEREREQVCEIKIMNGQQKSLNAFKTKHTEGDGPA